MANKVRVKIEHEVRMNWGGWFADPDLDPDVFGRYPTWRQAEIRETKELIKNYPNAVVSLLYDPSTRQPYPGQVLYSDIEKKLKAERTELPEVPAGFKYTIPNGVPLGLLFSQIPEPSEFEAHGILLTMEKYITRDTVLAACMSDKTLTANKPANGIFAFIWRLARYLSGADSVMPLTAFIDLSDGISAFTRLKVNPSRVKPIMQLLESRAEELVDAVGGNRYAGALRWAQAAGITR